MAHNIHVYKVREDSWQSRMNEGYWKFDELSQARARVADFLLYCRAEGGRVRTLEASCGGSAGCWVISEDDQETQLVVVLGATDKDILDATNLDWTEFP
jgi:hypothetical protein